MEDYQEYRNNLAKEIKEAPKEDRRGILDAARETDGYKDSAERKVESVLIKVSDGEMELVRYPNRVTTGGMGPCTGLILYDVGTKEALVGHYSHVLASIDDFIEKAKDTFHSLEHLKVYVGGLGPDEPTAHSFSELKNDRRELKKVLSDNHLKITKLHWTDDSLTSLVMNFDTKTGEIEFDFKEIE